MKIVKVLPTTLAAPLNANDTSFTLKSFVDSKKQPVLLSDIGEFIVLVIKQGDVTEIVKCNAITQNADGSATFGVATNGRNLNPKYPYTGSSEGEDFQASADVQFTNDPLTMFTFPNKQEDNVFEEDNIFEKVPQTTGGDPVEDNDLARRAWVLSVVLGGAVSVSSIKVTGIAGATVAAGDLVYLDAATARWKLCDADNPLTIESVSLGIAQGIAVDGGNIPGGVLIKGVDNNQSGMVQFKTQYASNTPGDISDTLGTNVMSVGISLTATSLYFDPNYLNTLTTKEKNYIGGLGGFGDASDGDVTIGVGATVVATRDMHYNVLTINGTLDSNGFIIYARKTAGNGVFRHNGVDGSNGPNNSQGALGGYHTAGRFKGGRGQNGAGGPNGGPGAGSSPVDPVSAVPSSIGVSNTAANGGAGSAYGAQPGGAGGVGGSVSPAVTKLGTTGFNTLVGVDISLTGATTHYGGSAGGGGGGSGGNTSFGTAGGGGGGGGGSGGGIPFLCVGEWGGSFTIQAKGGNGGTGGTATYGVTNGTSGGGGGGGGAGGTPVTIYGKKTWTGSYDLAGGLGGAGGVGFGGANGLAGNAGAVGTYYEIPVSSIIR